MSQADPQVQACISCQRGETEVPVMVWRFAGRSFVICPDCLPQLIHHRSQVMALWQLSGPSSADQRGGQDA